MNNKTRKILTVISGAITAEICLIMNLVLIPRIESSTKPIRCFDMNFGYDYETASEFLNRLSQDGRRIYLNVQLPLDFIYPIAYCLFFCLLLYTLSKGRKALFAAPIALAVFDYTENICSIIMLRSAELSKPLAAFASAATSIKTILMYATIIMILICLVFYLKNKRKKEEKAS